MSLNTPSNFCQKLDCGNQIDINDCLTYAISRHSEPTAVIKICPECGTREALEDYSNQQKKT